jgi:hypothetical protein
LQKGVGALDPVVFVRQENTILHVVMPPVGAAEPRPEVAKANRFCYGAQLMRCRPSADAVDGYLFFNHSRAERHGSS